MLVGFSGLARTGKDTASDHLVEQFGFTKYSFASPIKEACKVVFGWDEEHVNGKLKEVVDPIYGVSPRKAMQTLGTEWGRQTINENLWLLRAEQELAKVGKMVIADVRFNNEAQWILDNGGAVIHISRRGIDAVRSHPSEAGISSELINHYVHNNGSVESLHAQLQTIYNLIKP